MEYSTVTVSVLSYMKSPYKIPTVTSDNYQVMLTVIRRPKEAVHIIKANVQIVDISSHIGTQPSTPLVKCLVDDTLLQLDHATVRCRFRSAMSSMGQQ